MALGGGHQRGSVGFTPVQQGGLWNTHRLLPFSQTKCAFNKGNVLARLSILSINNLTTTALSSSTMQKIERLPK